MTLSCKTSQVINYQNNETCPILIVLIALGSFSIVDVFVYIFTQDLEIFLIRYLTI